MGAAQEVGMPLTGLEQRQAMIAQGTSLGIGRLLDVRLVGEEAGWTVFEAKPLEAVFNAIGSVHGGDARDLLDSAYGVAAQPMLDAEQTYITGELRTARRLGRARLTDADGRLVASATSSSLVISPELPPTRER